MAPMAARRSCLLLAVLVFVGGTGVVAVKEHAQQLQATPATSTFSVDFTSAAHSGSPVTGRLLVYLAVSNASSPISQCSDDQTTSQVFGVDVTDLGPNTPVTIPLDTLGYPRKSLADVPKSSLYAQAQLLRYDTYSTLHGKLVLPVSCINPGGGDGSYGAPVGTLKSDVVAISWDPANGDVHKLSLNSAVPATPSPGCAGNGQTDSKYIKTINVTSQLLTAWWGRVTQLQACVLLPFGFDEHPTTRYPLVISHGHYSSEWMTAAQFREHPPPPDVTGYDRIAAEYAYYLYRNWTEPDSGPFHGARMLVVTINHPTPFFDDSYAVNSANSGPYGDAIMRELIPSIEAKYRGIGRGWARGVYGGSTGGWESLAVQVFYPEAFNGAYASCPDPIAFSSFTTIDLYNDSNAYYYDSAFKQTARPGTRDHYSGTTIGYGHPYGQITATVEEMNHRELVLGTHSRSCGQWDAWESVFSPRGADGFPARVWDKATGAINKTVVAHWRDNYDILHRLKQDWANGLGEKLRGKLHIFVGGSDSFYLNDAVMDMQDFLSTTSNPPYEGEVVIGVHDGRGFEHCWSGYGPDGKPQPNSITRLTYNQRVLPALADRFAKTAPPGADLSWRY
eukprot:m.126735 g.126735  ORF g.126735 m.126735 type:complete len:619 (-) comp16685_c0_seq8:50-1906(-)